MPANKVSSSLSKRLGAKLHKAHEKVKGNETKYDQGGDLPAGIIGVAQLVEMKFGQYKTGELQGKDFFYAAGVVKHPTHHDGIPIEGKRTSIMEPLCDTPKSKTVKTFEQHLDNVYNELRKFGVDTNTMDPDDLDATVEALVEDGPHFEFRTWQGKPTKEYPNPRVNHKWNGTCEYDGAVDPEVQDDTADTDSEAGDEDTPDLKALAKAAKAKDQEAIDKLTELALAAGYEQDEIDGCKKWDDLVKMIENPKDDSASEGDDDSEASDDSDGEETSDGEESVDGEGEEAEPEEEEASEEGVTVGMACYFKPLDPKTKKPGAKRVEVEVIAVDKKAETADLKNLAEPNKLYRKIPWTRLIIE